MPDELLHLVRPERRKALPQRDEAPEAPRRSLDQREQLVLSDEQDAQARLDRGRLERQQVLELRERVRSHVLRLVDDDQHAPVAGARVVERLAHRGNPRGSRPAGAVEPEPPSDHLHQRRSVDAGMRQPDDDRAVGELRGERVGERGLADPDVSGQEEETADTEHGVLEGVQDAPLFSTEPDPLELCRVLRRHLSRRALA